MIEISTERTLSPELFIDVLERSGLAERRPVSDIGTIQAMLAKAGLLVTAWDGEELVGVARSVTDFAYCCYLSDLAVDGAYQAQGIGKKLITATREKLGPRCTLILLAAPAAVDYYPHIGFTKHESAWILRPGE